MGREPRHFDGVNVVSSDDHDVVERCGVDVVESRCEIGVADDETSIGDSYLVLEDAAFVGSVEGDIDRPEVVEAKPGEHSVRPVGLPREHVVAFDDSEVCESLCGSASVFECLTPCPCRPVLKDECDVVRLHFSPTFEQVTEDALVPSGNTVIEHRSIIQHQNPLLRC